MKLSDRDAFYEKMYFHEITARDRLDDSFRTLLAIAAIVFSLIGYLFKTSVLGNHALPALFWFIYCIAIVSFVAAVVCYIKAWHSQHYTAFPLLADIEHYIDQIRAHYEDKTDRYTAEQWSEEAFELYMRQSFIDHASFNARANDNKRFWLYYGNSFIISAFVFCAMAFLSIADIFLL